MVTVEPISTGISMNFIDENVSTFTRTRKMPIPCSAAVSGASRARRTADGVPVRPVVPEGNLLTPA